MKNLTFILIYFTGGNCKQLIVTKKVQEDVINNFFQNFKGIMNVPISNIDDDDELNAFIDFSKVAMIVKGKTI